MTKNALFLIVVISIPFNGCMSVKQGVQKTKAQDEAAKVKLPSDVVPLKYDLSLWVNPLADTFSGTVGIALSLLNDRHDLLLHAQDLEIMSVSIDGKKTENDTKFFVVNGDQGLMRIDFGETLAKGNYRLEIAYRAKYRDDLSGLYKVKENNESYLFTQMEPLSARKMLPCFDEPRFKTPFNIKVISPKGQTVIANGPLKTTIAQQSDEVHVFDTTKPLPSYLLALAVGPLDVVEGPSLKPNNFRSEAILFRGVATKGKGEKLKLALAETPQILERLEQYFGVAYPYQKLDIIAIPDFSAGAMENAGAVTFREWYLLLDEKTASVDQRRGFYLVMAHELAHQWFGNLVTMPWWDDLWLNEAFATWLSYKLVDDLKPAYKSAAHMLERSHGAMAQDSLAAARKIREPITSHHDIHNAFDSITYSKGGAVLSMLENYLGAAHFRDAVSAHIKRFADNTATSKDFLESLTRYSDATLASSAETFLNQTGVPEIKLSYRCEDKGFRIKVEQYRYVPIGSKSSSVSTWAIPMCVSYDDAGSIKKHCFTLNQQSMKVDVQAKSCPTFVMPNAKGQGYYRFSLNLEAWKNLLGASTAQLSEDDRLAIADSLVAQFYAGGADFAFVAEGLHGLIDTNSSILTGYFTSLIKEATDFWISPENQEHVIAYSHKALKDIYGRLSKTADLSTDQVTLKRDLANFLANVVKDKEVRLEMSLLGSAYLRRAAQGLSEDTTALDTSDEDLLSDAVAVSMQFETDEELEKIAASLSTITDTVTRGHLLYGLAHSREGKEAQRVRSYVFNDNLRRNEQLRLFYDHLQNPRNQPETWQFLKSNLSQFKKALSKQQISNLPYLAEGLCEVSAANDVKQFFSPFISEYQGGPRNLAEVIQQIEICAARKSHATVLANRFVDGLKDQVMVEREKPTP